MSAKKPIVAQPSKIKEAKMLSGTQKGVKGFVPGKSGKEFRYESTIGFRKESAVVVA